MDKLERRLARLWRRMRGGKRRERRSSSKKRESSPPMNRGEITSNNKQRHETVNDHVKDQRDSRKDSTLRRNHSKHEEKDLNHTTLRRNHSKHDERDVKETVLRRNHSKHEERDVKETILRRNHSKHEEKDPKNGILRRNHSKHEDNERKDKIIKPRIIMKPEESGKSSQRSQAIQRPLPQNKDLSSALIRLYAYARLKALQNSIVAGSARANRSITEGYDIFDENFKPLERQQLLSSLPQLTLNRFGSKEFDKTSQSRDSGYFTGSPRDFTSSSETLRQPKSPIVSRPRTRDESEVLPYKRRFHASHGDILSSGATAVDSSIKKLDTIETFLSRNVYKSKCVTSLFEAAHAGLDVLIDDVLAEFDHWFVGRKMLVVASELHFSVPLAKRSRRLEQVLKQQMLRSLLENNRRILYLRGKGEVLPVHMAEARTEENIYNNREMQAIQGVYQRCYYKLLPFVHTATPSWHAPFWKLTKPPLVITAWSVFDSTKNASRVLRIELEDVDDNAPLFIKGAQPVFVVARSSGRSSLVIGQVFAEDRDGDDLNVIHYYLLPKCTSTTEFDIFAVNDYTGEITISAEGLATGHANRIELCLLASNYADLNVAEVAFDAKNASMVRVAVVFEGEALTSAAVPSVENNTVMVLEENLRDTTISVTQSDAGRDVRFALDHVDFKPALDSTSVLHTSTNSLFFVEPTTGDIRVNPAVSEQPQGVYNVFVNILSSTTKEVLQQFVKKFHYVKDEMKMRYVFNTTSEEFARGRDEFAKKVQTALAMDHPEGKMEVFLSKPKKDKRSSSWTSVCFHTTMNAQVQNERSAMSGMSQSTAENSELSRLYHIYKIINIERCEAEPAVVRQSAYALPLQVIMLVAGVAILILILITLTTYICFVRRYKEHLRGKQKMMNGTEKVQCVVDPTPAFILPPPAPRLGYY